MRNWAGNIEFQARQLLRPTSVAKVQSMVASSDKVRVLGSGHSFNAIADTTGDQISLHDLPPLVEVDSTAATVRVSGGVRYGDVAALIDEHGFALRNMGSLPHIAIAGATATGTHGSGDGNGVLATSVAALQLVTADGDRVELTRDDADFNDVIIGLGSIGVVTALTLDLVPTYQLHQYVYGELDLDDVTANLDEILASAYSVSIFTRWRDHRVDGIWLKSAAPRDSGEFFGAEPAAVAAHPIPGVDPAFTTQQLGVPGPWYQRLPHFRLEFTPSNGDELQSEYFVDRIHGPDALRALDELGPILAPVLLTSEIRSIARDHLGISPANGRDRLALHFTWVRDSAAVAPVLDEIERRLAPFDAVPHWGKVFRTTPQRLAELHPRLADFAALVRRYDPAAKLANDFTTRFVRGPFGG